MNQYFSLLLALGVACTSAPSGDDDDSGGAAGDVGSGGKGGKGGSAGTTTGGGAEGGTSATGGTSSGSSGASGTATGGSPGAGGSTGGADATGGTEQGGTGGDQGLSGDGQGGEPAPGTGGTGDTSGTGGTSGTGNPGGVPIVELLLDGSSSMFENGMWEQVYTSLVTDGVLGAVDGKLELGLSVFQGNAMSTSEESAACATMTNVDFSSSSGDAIASTIQSLGDAYVVGDKWETPTGFAVRYASMVLAALPDTGDRKKYIVLVTDGAPNTCVVLDPQCGEDTSIKAVQDARATGIRTLAVGLDPVLDPNAGCPPSARCGADHLQDLANAGVAEPVEPAAEFYNLEPCIQGHTLLASYAAVGGGGDATYYLSTNDGGLTSELTRAFQAIIDDDVP
jgi:hypothetical protein